MSVGSNCPECGDPISPVRTRGHYRELFVVGVRLIGVWFLAAGVEMAVGVIDILFNLTPEPPGIPPTGMTANLTWLIVYGAMGLYFLLGAPHLVALTYVNLPKPK